MAKDEKKPIVKLVFDRRKLASRARPGYLEFSIFYDGQRVRINTGLSVFPTEWSDGKIIRRDDKNYLNSTLRFQQQQIMNIITKGMEEGNFSITSLKGFSFVQDKKKKEKEIRELDFFEWLERKISERPIRESTRKQHLVMMRKLKESGIIRDFCDLTTKNIRKWDNYLHNTLNINNEYRKQTTVYSLHKRFKPYVREAYELELIPSLPYSTLHIPRGKAEGIKYLRESERDLIENVKLSGTNEIARDMFIFSCYTGLSYSDLVKIQKKDVFKEGELYFIEDKRQKTGTKYKITLLPKAMEILKKYDYNLNRLSNQKCNVHLKMVAAIAGLDKNLTMHMGRHTFATWALNKGVRMDTVGKMLGHENVITTQQYAKILQEAVNEGYQMLMEK